MKVLFVTGRLAEPLLRETLAGMGDALEPEVAVLGISVRTVEVHRFNLMRRLNVRNVAQLLRRALQLGLLSKSFGK